MGPPRCRCRLGLVVTVQVALVGALVFPAGKPLAGRHDRRSTGTRLATVEPVTPPEIDEEPGPVAQPVAPEMASEAAVTKLEAAARLEAPSAPSRPENAPRRQQADGTPYYATLRHKRFAGSETSVLFPFLSRPPLLDGTHAGDCGFDPLRLAGSNEELYALMESEIRHARLAMLCAAGWPLSELPSLSWFDGALLADGGRAPSVLNGHLFNPPSLLVVLAFFAAVSRQELIALRTPKKQTLYGSVHARDMAEVEDEWPWGVPGDLDFDPLGLYGTFGRDPVGRKVMRDLEIQHGRVAMIAVLLYVLLEASTGRPVVDLAPFLFNNY